MGKWFSLTLLSSCALRNIYSFRKYATSFLILFSPLFPQTEAILFKLNCSIYMWIECLHSESNNKHAVDKIVFQFGFSIVVFEIFYPYLCIKDIHIKTFSYSFAPSLDLFI